MTKCSWANGSPIEEYHDLEHGKFPVSNDLLFEMLTLEIFQPGLSFNIVLKKREGLRQFFKQYNIDAISKMNEDDVLLGLDNNDIIKHRLKIESVISNAKLIVENGINLTEYIFETIDYRFGLDKVGTLLSKQMKKDGFKFVGPSVTTSLLEAIGLLNGHFDYCLYRPISKGTFNYQSPYGALYVEYDNFTITSSRLLHNTICEVKEPCNSFELYLQYLLDLYFINNKYSFKLLLDTKGTQFQELVWDAIRHVPYGETRSYGDIAFTIGSNAFRAVGGACSKSNFAIFIPAHRVISSSGIGGFQNQVSLKRDLLKHEGLIVD